VIDEYVVERYEFWVQKTNAWTWTMQGGDSRGAYRLEAREQGGAAIIHAMMMHKVQRDGYTMLVYEGNNLLDVKYEACDTVFIWGIWYLVREYGVVECLLRLV
jgi:hypothetical protein